MWLKGWIMSLFFFALPGGAWAAPATTQANRYPLLPMPRQVSFGEEFRADGPWNLHLNGVDNDSKSVQALTELLNERCKITLGDTADALPVELAIQAGSVKIGDALDLDKNAIEQQAYRIQIADRHIRITANAEPGLFYGVQTLVQLVQKHDDHLWLPTATIADWPDISLRQIYWDDAHHLEKLGALKQAVKTASFFKINGFVIKLEGHFQFKHAPALVEPYALSPEELQELTDYAAKWHVQVIPYLDGPAHIAFILKHPEYAKLRAFPDSNYELDVVNPASYDLLFGMYDDLMQATRGSKYFYLSTDEPYYVGYAPDEAKRMKEVGSPGKLLAEFIDKTATYLHQHGREVVFWGETPLKKDDVAMLPNFIINGETGDADFNAAFKAQGIPQMIYTSTQGEEPLFPDYFVLPPDRRLHERKLPKPRVSEGIKSIAQNPARTQNAIVGTFVAGWADSGLHPVTFWLGYATISAAAWSPQTDADAAMADFFALYYGRDHKGMEKVFELMSRQAQTWADSWDTGHSQARKPIWGNSSSRFEPRRPALDQSIPLPPVPAQDTLAISNSADPTRARRLDLVKSAQQENDDLMKRLELVRAVEFNRDSAEVMRAIAQLCKQNLNLIQQFDQITDKLAAAGQAANDNHPDQAVAKLDEALDAVEKIRQERNDAMHVATETFYRTWQPRVAEASGRKFLHELDDVKDHLPDRTVGMEYLVYRELILPVGDWTTKVLAVRNAYAKAHQLPERTALPDWSNTE